MVATGAAVAVASIVLIPAAAIAIATVLLLRGGMPLPPPAVGGGGDASGDISAGFVQPLHFDPLNGAIVKVCAPPVGAFQRQCTALLPIPARPEAAAEH